MQSGCKFILTLALLSLTSGARVKPSHYATELSIDPQDTKLDGVTSANAECEDEIQTHLEEIAVRIGAYYSECQVNDEDHIIFDAGKVVGVTEEGKELLCKKSCHSLEEFAEDAPDSSELTKSCDGNELLRTIQVHDAFEAARKSCPKETSADEAVKDFIALDFQPFYFAYACRRIHTEDLKETSHGYFTMNIGKELTAHVDDELSATFPWAEDDANCQAVSETIKKVGTAPQAYTDFKVAASTLVKTKATEFCKEANADAHVYYVSMCGQGYGDERGCPSLSKGLKKWPWEKIDWSWLQTVKDFFKREKQTVPDIKDEDVHSAFNFAMTCSKKERRSPAVTVASGYITLDLGKNIAFHQKGMVLSGNSIWPKEDGRAALDKFKIHAYAPYAYSYIQFKKAATKLARSQAAIFCKGSKPIGVEMCVSGRYTPGCPEE